MDTPGHAFGESNIRPYFLGLATGATLQLFAYTYGQEEAKRATNNVRFGTEQDPNIKAIRGDYSLAPVLRDETSRALGLEEEEAVHSYRIGLNDGLVFNWVNQRSQGPRR